MDRVFVCIKRLTFRLGVPHVSVMSDVLLAAGPL